MLNLIDELVWFLLLKANAQRLQVKAEKYIPCSRFTLLKLRGSTSISVKL